MQSSRIPSRHLDPDQMTLAASSSTFGGNAGKDLRDDPITTRTVEPKGFGGARASALQQNASQRRTPS